MKSHTVTVSASRYIDSDDCLEAARAEAARRLDLEGWALGARWTDDERETITLDVPEHALLAARETGLYSV